MLTADDLAARLSAKRVGKEYVTHCPAHPDRDPSLNFAAGRTGGIVFQCRSRGCALDAILAGLNLTPGDVSGNGRGTYRLRRDFVYTDERGAPLFRVVRVDPGFDGKDKSIWQEAARPGGTWAAGTKGVRRVPYRLHAIHGQATVYVAEGEPLVERLEAAGFPATCNVGGAAASDAKPKWTEADTAAVKAAGAREAVIFPDHDAVGETHARAVAASLTRAGLSARIVALPGLTRAGDDLLDWFAAGHTVAELRALVDATPAPAPEAAEPPAIGEPFAAFHARLGTVVRPPDVVPGLIPHDGITMFHGHPRGLKSWCVLECVRAVATGTAAFGVARFAPSAPRPAWYVTEEDGPRIVDQRITCLFAGLQQAIPAHLHVSIWQHLDLDDPTCQAQVVAYARQQTIAWTVFDPIRSLSAGVDQGPTEIRPLALFLRSFRDRTGSAVALVHHDVKPPTGRADDRPRPHRASGGGIFSIVETPIHVEAIEVAAAKHAILVPSHYKLSVDPPPLVISLETDDPATPTWARVRAQEATGTDAETFALHQKILTHLRVQPGRTGNQVAKAVHAKKETVLAALDALLQAGALDNYPGKGNATCWLIAAR